MNALTLVTLLSSSALLIDAESILTSQVFIIPIRPDTFDWNVNGKSDKYSYQTSLLHAPDLPSWIHYTYSKADHQGYLYGVAPRNQTDFKLEVVALDKQTYDTRYKVLDMTVNKNENFAKFQIQLKIDNLNVEDLFDSNRTQNLFNIFKKELWKSATDLQLTFLASAVELGARLPLNPGEGEGVVIRLGSSVTFSKELLKLEEQVKPLRKLSSCSHKKTTVERLFRDGPSVFNLDWCYFRLIEENDVTEESAGHNGNVNVVGLSSTGVSERSEWRWTRPSKATIPKRSYLKEIATTIFIPVFLLFVLASLLSATLCLHHEKLIDPESDKYFHELFNVFLEQKVVVSEKRELTPVEGLGNNGVQMVQYATSSRGNTLKSVSTQPSSPCDSLTHSPRTSTERCNPYIRPNPPPYMGSNNLFLTIQGASEDLVLLRPDGYGSRKNEACKITKTGSRKRR